MCYQLVELYSACRCLYYQHAIDRCAAYGRPGHNIEQRTIYVGYACSAHTGHSAQYAHESTYSDSGYAGPQILRFPRLLRFELDDWISFLYSANPSSIVLMLVRHRRQSATSPRAPT
ncbi:hypothetical protein MKX08_009219 [Trichoderma sp. CBMAI-0020]|nr:hypothetical protein MKX08_009219 [Trichoderma sp. CBMAI-0020]WOD45713.1 hypothetical protein [Trichoderma atroviride]